MTVREFYEWAKSHNAENLEVEIQWRDGGGTYLGRDILNEDFPINFDISEFNDEKQVVVI